jgi:hypothetical protein
LASKFGVKMKHIGCFGGPCGQLFWMTRGCSLYIPGSDHCGYFSVCHSERLGIGKLLLKPSDIIWILGCIQFLMTNRGYAIPLAGLINSIPTQGSSQHPRYWRVNWLNDVKEVESPIFPACPNHFPTIGWRKRDK